jgi:hypothetical protein
MLRLKPITILALDPHAAAFCISVRERLARDFGSRGNLIQTQVLTSDDGTLEFTKNLENVADPRFDLEFARQQANRPEPSAVHRLYEKDSASLEPSLIEMFESGRSAAEIDAARRDNVEIVRQRNIFLILSSSDPFANGVVINLTRQIRWLFATRFTEEQYFLQAVILLPGLFLHPEPSDYAATYDLMKKVDHSARGIFVTSLMRKVPPFEACWLMDGNNARGDRFGSMAEQLDSYSDAFVGFVTAEPETSGALPGTRLSRGKSPAYSSFGHGELYFPGEAMISRLASALARDILSLAFLSEEAATTDNRKLMLATKQFLLSKDFVSALDGLEREKGAPIWQGFKPVAELSEGAAGEYTTELQRSHQVFTQETLPKMQRSLMIRRDEVKSEIERLIDQEIDLRVDTGPEGLINACGLLETMTDPAIALRADVLGEQPQNLITLQRQLAGHLDQRLGIVVDHTETSALFNQLHELRNNLSALKTTIRLAATPSINSPDAKPSSPVSEIHDQKPPDLNEQKEELEQDIQDIETEITETQKNYQGALIEEDRIAHQIRFEATNKLKESKAQAIAECENELGTADDRLREALRLLDELQQERRKYLMSNYVINPLVVIGLIVVVPLLLDLAGFETAGALLSFVWENLTNLIIGFIILALIYSAIIFYFFHVGINRRVVKARAEVNALRRLVVSAAESLRRARNDQLQFEFELYAQAIRTETGTHLVDAVTKRLFELKTLVTSLIESRDRFARQHKESIPASSATRRPVLSPEDIDTYYNARQDEIRKEADAFTRDQVSRSAARRLKLDELNMKLESFARSRFSRLSTLTIQDVLLREPLLLPPEQALRSLRELDDAAEPLIQLRDVDAGDDFFAQRDITLWAGMGNHDELLSSYQKIRPLAIVRPSRDERALRALSRCLNYPAYFISQIDFYRACYQRMPPGDSASLPDLLPSEFGAGAEVTNAHEKLLMALSLGLVSKDKKGSYVMHRNGNKPLGQDRKVIAEKLATDFAYQELYSDLCEDVDAHITDAQVVQERLVEFASSMPDLDPAEEEILSKLRRKYHPLR